MASTMLSRMDCFGLTDVGRSRPTNQDHYLIADLNKSMRIHATSLSLDDETRVYGGSQGKLLLVADGMGGEALGDRACTIAVDRLTTYVLNSLSWCYRLEAGSENDFEEDLKHALESCQQGIQLAISEHPEMQNMGTTMTMAYVVWPRAFVVHAGDSRCYLLRDKRLEQVTVDHTLAQMLAADGRLSRDEAKTSPMSHVLWNVIGGRSSDLTVDVYKLTLKVGDNLLLCTDGLFNMASDEQVQRILCSATTSEDACRTLVELANENGGKDNVTVIVSRFLSTQPEQPRAFVEAEVPLEVLTSPEPNSNTASR
jgi:serine/threonine protein phosphatase PrpC